MGKGKKRTFEREYVQVPNETAQASQIYINKKLNENPLSLEAQGLLLNLWSYPDTFEVHKTELYKRFAYNKETSVKRAWKCLIDTGYMVEYKYRDGKRWEYVYEFSILPFTEEQRQIIWQEATEEYGEIWGLDFPDLKMETSNCGPQEPEISNTLSKQDLIKEKLNKKNKELVNKELENLPEKNLNKKQECNSSVENITPSELNADFFINTANEFYTKFSVGRWSKDQWTNIVFRLTTEILRSEIELYNPKGYVYRCLENIVYRHDLKHGKIEPRKPENDLPFYDWWLD